EALPALQRAHRAPLVESYNPVRNAPGGTLRVPPRRHLYGGPFGVPARVRAHECPWVHARPSSACRSAPCRRPPVEDCPLLVGVAR
ncbi:hypothetical protein, partial [Streptomyces aureus]